MGISKLYFKKLGSGHPLIILHGLYGSGSNWYSIAKELSGLCEIYLLDQRNHGNSPHHDDHNYPVLMEDLIQFMDEQDIPKAVLLGHSMGGKTAIYTATQYPGRVSKLIVADISPLSYYDSEGVNRHSEGHKKIIRAMMGLDLKSINNLKEADEKLSTTLPDKKLRQFLMKNLSRDKVNGYYWNLNLKTLFKNINSLADGLNPEYFPFEGFSQFPVLFVKGEDSDYIGEKDAKAIKSLFPNSNIERIPNAGHWLHAEEPERFVKIVKTFLIQY